MQEIEFEMPVRRTPRFSPSGHPVMPATFLIALSCLVGCQRSSTESYPADTKLALAIRSTFAAGAVEEKAEQGGATITPTGWATLKGRFHVQGTPRANPTLTVSGDDMAICAPGGKMPDAGTITVDGNGGLKNVAIYVSTELEAAEPWTHPDAAPGKATEAAIFDQKSCLFVNRVFAVRAGQTVGIKNSDPVGHNTNIQAKTNSAFNQNIPANSVVNWSAKKEEKQGPIPVSCSIHPWMKCYMLIRANGYFAVSKEDGAFEIANLPAGVPLEFRVWHEAAEFFNGIEVQGQKVKKGRFVLTLDPADQAANTLDVAIDAALLK